MLAVLWGCGAEYQISAPLDVDPADVTECAFVPDDDRPALSSYDCNPVFQTTNEGWAPSLGGSTFAYADVLGHPFYQVWYVGYDSESPDDWQLGYAVSADGTEWEAHEDNPGAPEREKGAWDGGWMQSPEVDFDPEAQSYYMLYGGISKDEGFFGVGLAGSRDGASWEMLPENPVLSLGGPYDGVQLSWPLAFDVRKESYEAWFAGSSPGGDQLDIYQISTREISDWYQPVESVFEHGEDGAWDDQGFIDAAVVELDGIEYMFYIGFGDWLDEGDVRYSEHAYVGLATREPGERWKRTSDDPLPLTQTRQGHASAIAAQVVGKRIHLWVTDLYDDLGTQAVGYFLYDPSLDEGGDR